jgi:hypothetical protein
METNDKLKLLFFVGNSHSLSGSSYVMPTFATSTTYLWPIKTNSYFEACDSATGCNFELSSKKTISMKRTSLGGGGYKLNIKPIQYFKGFGKSLESVLELFWINQNTNSKRLGLNEPLQVVYIPMFYFKSTGKFVNEYFQNENHEQVQFILLVGNFERNIWVLHRGYNIWLDTEDIIMEHSFGNDAGFDIY